MRPSGHAGTDYRDTETIGHVSSPLKETSEGLERSILERSTRVAEGRCPVKGFSKNSADRFHEGSRLVSMARGDGQRPTIYDVAERAGVSKSLVSLVLQGSPGVSEARRGAVLAAITELGYRPNRAATELASHRTKSIELVIDDYRNLSFVGLLAGISSELAGHGYHLAVTDTQLNAHLSRERQASILSTNLDGLIIAGELDDELLDMWTGPTVVAGWRDTIPERADLVANDDEMGGRIAADHLIELGHRVLGHLTGSTGPATHRRTGFIDQVTARGVETGLAGASGGTSEEDGYQAACELLDSKPSITAIFAANDTMALGALAAIRARGLSVPADVSVIGYDNSPLAHYRYLEITSIDDRSDVVGAAAGRALLDRLADPGSEPRRTLVEPTLVVRTTTAPPP
jgi:DNA-binding LacI/PurR family transcriptional regulator